jgi:hypothetical protein
MPEWCPRKCGKMLEFAKENVMYSKKMFDEVLKQSSNQLCSNERHVCIMNKRYTSQINKFKG